MKPDKRKQELEDSIKFFEDVQKRYPNGGYDKILSKLYKDRTDHVNQIGRKSSVHNK